MRIIWLSKMESVGVDTLTQCSNFLGIQASLGLTRK